MRGKDDKKNADKYLGRAKKALILEAAAEAWAAGGIEWEDAKAKAQAKAGLYAKAKAKPKAQR